MVNVKLEREEESWKGGIKSEMVLFGKVKNKGVIMKSLKILMLIALPLAVVLSGRAEDSASYKKIKESDVYKQLFVSQEEGAGPLVKQGITEQVWGNIRARMPVWTACILELNDGNEANEAMDLFKKLAQSQ